MSSSKRIQARHPDSVLAAFDQMGIQHRMETYHRLGHADFVLMYGEDRVPQSNEYGPMEDFKGPDGKIYRSEKYWHDKARIYIQDSGLEDYLRRFGIRFCPPEHKPKAEEIVSSYDWPIRDEPVISKSWKDDAVASVSLNSEPQLKYPDGNPKTKFGITKPRDTYTPPIPYLEYSLAHLQGALKYGPFNWRDDPVTMSTYLDAAISHIKKFREGQDRARDTDIHELGHAMTCLSIVIDGQAYGTITDDRWKPRDPEKHPNYTSKLDDWIESNQDRVKAIREKWTNFAERYKNGEVDKNGDPVKTQKEKADD